MRVARRYADAEWRAISPAIVTHAPPRGLAGCAKARRKWRGLQGWRSSSVAAWWAAPSAGDGAATTCWRVAPTSTLPSWRCACQFPRAGCAGWRGARPQAW